MFFFFFFFSSRRRHTRLQGDWSSDVCSSDLGQRRDQLRQQRATGPGGPAALRRHVRRPRIAAGAGGLGGLRQRRSEERRVGEEGRTRWAPDHLKKKKKNKRSERCTR